ncbi:MAG: recF [Bacteroidetes bacterium]|nr:recF [Bacteroidota bacterium]
MKVGSIGLRGFRNHEATRAEFGGGINALLGDNGEGKTNLLEAIAYLSLTKSFYGAHDRVVAKIGGAGFEVDGRLVTDAGSPIDVRASFDAANGVKTFTVNGARPETMASVIGRFPVVILSPENAGVTSGAPAERRRFMDLILCQVSPVYLEDLQEYRRILRQRNRVLLDMRTGRGGILEPWTLSLAARGAEVVVRRRAFVREFIPYIREAYREVVEERETPDIVYTGVEAAGGTADTESLRDLLLRMMEERGGEERARGTSLVGPHRDDLILSVSGRSLLDFGSQGQHKTMLVALKLAEFRYIREQRGERPLLLLDDLFGELDDRRSRRILATLAPLGQTVVTTTDEGHFHGAVPWDGANRRFRIERGGCIAA